MNTKREWGQAFKLAPLAAALIAGQTAVANAQEEGEQLIMEVVTVTSTKRETTLMETGQAVSAFGADKMEELGVDGSQGLTQFSPSLVISSSKIAIRGIGRPNNALGSDPGVGIYTDGVYNTENGVIDHCNFCDVDRVEVLRGPQGTLYGRNAVGGAINIISADPTESFGGYFNLEAGNYGHSVAQAQVSGPLNETFSGIMTVSKVQRDGLQENLAEQAGDLDNRDKTYFSGKLVADWSENWTSSLRYMDYSRSETPSAGYLKDEYPTDMINLGAGNLPGMFPGSNALNHLMGYQRANPAVSDISKINVDTSGHLESESTRFIFTNVFSMGDLDLKYTFGDYEYSYDKLADGDVANAAHGGMNFSEMFRQMTSVPGFGADGVGHYLPSPLDGSPITVASDMTASVVMSGESTSHELQLISNFSGSLNFISGLYYYNSNESQYTDFVERGYGLMHGDMIAAYYGNIPPAYGLPADTGTFLGVPGMQMGLYQFYALAMGGMPFQQTADGQGGYLYYGQNNLETTATAAYGQLEYAVSDALTLTAGVRYSEDEKKGSDEVFAYLSVPTTEHQVDDSWSSTTWRLQADWAVDDETFIYGYVATGYRSGGFNLGAATASPVDLVAPEELTAYEIGYKKLLMDNRMNLAIAAYYYDYQDLQVLSAVVDGGVTTVSFDNAAKATAMGVEIEAQMLLTDSLIVMGSYSYGKSEYDDYHAIDSVACAFVGECGVQDLSGNQLNMAPEQKFSLAATQTFSLGDMGSLALTMSYSQVGEQYSRSFNRDDWDRVDSYDSIDGRLAWRSPSEAFTVAAFVKNAQDERNVLRYDTPSTVTRMQNAEVSDPMTYGIQVRYDFGQ